MRFLALLAVAYTAAAQPTLDGLLSAAFPSDLTASPTGGKVAWVSNAKGVRNILVAEAPGYQARKITNYTEDDGQELRQLRFTPDGAAVVYVRGDSSNGRDGVPNPVSLLCAHGKPRISPARNGRNLAPPPSPVI